MPISSSNPTRSFQVQVRSGVTDCPVRHSITNRQSTQPHCPSLMGKSAARVVLIQPVTSEMRPRCLTLAVPAAPFVPFHWHNVRMHGMQACTMGTEQMLTLPFVDHTHSTLHTWGKMKCSRAISIKPNPNLTSLTVEPHRSASRTRNCNDGDHHPFINSPPPSIAPGWLWIPTHHPPEKS